MKRILSIACAMMMLALFTTEGKAQLQAGNYSFSAVSGTYTPIVGGTATPDLLADSELDTIIPLGFTFMYEGVAYTSARASSNGFLTFNTTSGTTNSGTTNDLDFITSTLRPLVAPLWDDLDGRAVGGSSASYVTTGVAPNRVFTFEWSAWEWRWNASDSVISFQVKLYETTNVVEFVYEQGPAGIVGTGSASIGISGVATGAGNFLSLDGAGTNPAASFTSETTNINAKPATGQIYRFTPPVLFPLDMRAINVIAPPFDGCYTANETVRVVVENFGTSTIDFSINNTTVAATATGTNPANLSVVINSGTLASNAVDTFTVSSTYDMTAGGTYTFQGYTNVTGDGNTSNDTMAGTVSVTNDPTVAIPISVDFTGFTGSNLSTVFPGWTEGEGGTTPSGTTSLWTDQTGVGSAGNVTAKVNLFTTSRDEWIISPKFTVAANTKLFYKVAITDFASTTAPAVMGADDFMEVRISTDCGFSWTAIDSVVPADALPPTLTQRIVDLAAYSGQDVIVAFYAQDGPVNDPEDYDLHIDDIDIANVNTKDMRAVNVLAPPFDGCYTANETVRVVIENFGSATIDFSVDNTTVAAIITGPNPSTISTVLNTGTLASNALDTITVSTTYDMTAAGIHGFQGYTLVAGDGNTGNDTMASVVNATVEGLASIPQSVNFDGFTGSNLTTAFPDWREGSGATIPGGTSSDWTDQTGLVSAGNVTATINLYSDFHEDWIVGPRVAASQDLQLTYEVAITDWLSTTVGDSMGSDDRLYAMLSLDCGFSWFAVDSVTRADRLPVSLTRRIVDLSTYAGQEIHTAFFATGGTVNDPEDYDLHLDNINIDLVPFRLLDPVDGTVAVIEGNGTNTIDARWTSDITLSGTINYRWFADTVGGDFSNPYVVIGSNNAGADTSLTLDYTTVDGLLASLGLAVGDSVDLIWTVRAYNGTDSSEAEAPFNLRLFRGTVLEDFDLLSPANVTVLVVEGNQNQMVNILWEESVDGANYTWILETAAGAPVTTIPTATDTTLDLSYGDIDGVLNAAGVTIGNSIALRWTVAATFANDTTFAANGYFDLDLTREALTDDFNLLTPPSGTAVLIEGDQSQTLEPTWEDAQVNGDGDITYTWLLDAASGDFSNPILSLPADNGGIDEQITLTYGDIASTLTANGINIGMTLNAQWTVETNFGDRAAGPFTIDLTRGVMTGIGENREELAGVSIYPNPSNGTFQLTVDEFNSGLLNMEVLNLQGTKVFDDQLTAVNGQLTKVYEIDALSDGVYFVRVYDDVATKTIRLVVQK